MRNQKYKTVKRKQMVRKNKIKKGCVSLLAAAFILSNFPIIGNADKNALEMQETSNLQTEERKVYEIGQIDADNLKDIETFQIPNTLSLTINPYASTYGKEWIKQYYKENSQKQGEALRLYDLIVTYIEFFQNGTEDAQFQNNQYYFKNKLDISSIGKNFTEKELEMVYTTVLYDHPEFYVTKGIYYEMDYQQNIKSIIGICENDYVQANVRKKIQDEIEKNVQRYLDEVAGLKTDIEKEIAIHNKMLEEVTYEKANTAAAYAHNIVSVLDDNKATMPVCEGYAKTFQLLLNACGIENVYVVGNGRGQAHAWNIVKLDGAYYYADVTWDDARYETIEAVYKREHPNVNYTPIMVGEWAQSEGLFWRNENSENIGTCTVENTVYYYFNKIGNSFTSEHIPANVFNLNGTSINQEQYSLPALASSDYTNTVVKPASYVLTYDNISRGKLNIYNAGVEVKSGSSVAEGTVLTLKFQPLDIVPIYSIYAENTLIPVTKENNEYVGTFTMAGKNTTIIIQAKEPEVTGISLNKTALSFSSIGNTEQLIAKVEPESAQNKNVKWMSSNPSIATVDANGIVKAVSNGTAKITVTTEEGNKSAVCDVTVDTTKPSVPVAVTGIKLDNPILNIFTIGQTEQLYVSITPSNATNQNVTWKTDNGKVAAVDKTGKVTAVANGIAHITATTEDGKKTATCTVTVDTTNAPSNIPVTGISLDRAELTLYQIPATEYLKAEISPSNAANKTIIWKSSNPNVAVVNTTGEITSISNGTTVITATTEDGQKTATCTVTVDTTNTPSNIKVTGIVLNKTEVSLTRSGATETVKAVVYPTNATNQKVRWHSNKTSIATVNSDGTITAVRTGTATITATTDDGKFVASCTVNVKVPSSNSSSNSDKGNSSSKPSGSKPSSDIPSDNNTIVTTNKNVWESNANNWKYRDVSGQYVKDAWAQINGKWYHFGTDNYMQKGWLLDKNGKWYYLDPINGDMKAGWQKVNNKWYYLNPQSGEMMTKWQKVNNLWYFMDAKTGEMKTQWIWVDNKWYYLKQDGAMLTGWQKINGKWYYLASSGECLMNTTTPDGKKVDKNGVWIP